MSPKLSLSALENRSNRDPIRRETGTQERLRFFSEVGVLADDSVVGICSPELASHLRSAIAIEVSVSTGPTRMPAWSCVAVY